MLELSASAKEGKTTSVLYFKLHTFLYILGISCRLENIIRVEYGDIRTENRRGLSIDILKLNIDIYI